MKQLLIDIWDATGHWSERHHLTASTIALLAPVLLFMWGVYDRKPPITLVGQVHPGAPRALPGGELTFEWVVRRNVNHTCTTQVQRFIIDSTGAQRVYGATTWINHDSFHARQLHSPDRMRITLPIPDTLPPGVSHMITDQRFTCPRNVLTFIWPIEQTWDWTFEVLPRTPLQLGPLKE